MTSPLSGARVLVTGASGCLGRRLVERLVVECGANVRVVVRSVMRAAPIARFPIQIVAGDLADRRVVETSADGCSVIFHCARGKGRDATARRAVDVEASAGLVRAAARSGARLVHVSSMAVYDRPADGWFDEGTADARPGDLYADAKLHGEQAALGEGARLGVSVAVIQPAIIYGPYSAMVEETIEALRTTRTILVNGGLGICNVVYVDDVVTALLLAATSDRASGERFLISGPEHPTWADVVGAFERLLGVHRTVSLTESAALDFWRQSQRSRWLIPSALRALRGNSTLRRRLIATREGRAIVWLLERITGRVPSEAPAEDGGEPPVDAVRPWVVRNMARRARVSIDKARRVLGYEPAFTLQDGMHLTGQWARWAGLVRQA